MAGTKASVATAIRAAGNQADRGSRTTRPTTQKGRAMRQASQSTIGTAKATPACQVVRIASASTVGVQWKAAARASTAVTSTSVSCRQPRRPVHSTSAAATPSQPAGTSC